MKSFSLSLTIKPEWIDYNGHLQDAYYGLIASEGINQMMIDIGIDQAYREAGKGTIYTIEDHRFYLNEIKGLRDVLCKSFVLDADKKRVHLLQEIWSEDQLGAVVESMLLHVRQKPQPHAVAMGEDIQKVINDYKLVDDQVHRFQQRAARIGIRRK